MTTNINLYVDQGVDYAIEVNVFNSLDEEIVISDQTITSKAKKMYAATPTFIIDVIVDTNDGDANNLTLTIPAARTANTTPGKYLYDVILDDNTTKTKILEGLLILLPSVSL